MAGYTEYPKSANNAEARYSSVLDLCLKCSSLMILLSVVNLVTYYYSFNIQIINYLEMTEITSLFLNQLPNYLLLLVPVILLLSIWSSLFNGMLSVFLLLVHWITSNTNIQARAQFLVICMALYLPVALIFYRHKAEGDLHFLRRNPEYRWKLIVYIFTSSILATSLDSKFSAMLVKNRYLYRGTEMVLDGKKVVSDSTFYYVGQTRNFIFWYDAQRKSPRIYPADKLQEITIHTIDLEMYFKMTPEECHQHLSRHGLQVYSPVQP